MAEAKRHIDALLALPRDQRSAAAEALLESLEDDLEDPDARQAWVDELQRRLADASAGIPAQDVLAEGRARLKAP